MEKIEVASLQLNTDDLIKSTAKVKKDIDELKVKQKELGKASADGSEEAREAYIKNELELKKLSKSYAENTKAILANEQAVEDLAKAESLITSAMNNEISTVSEARSNIALLTRLRNETNTSTEEGRKQLIALNNAIDSNNDFIKENADELLKLKMNIGNYADSMKDAVSQMNPFNGGLLNFIQNSQDAGGASKLLTNGLSAVTSGLKGMITAGLAFIATPIGAAIAVLALAVGAITGAFKFMTNEMSKTEEGSNKLAKVMSIFSGVINTVTKALAPLAEFIFNKFVGALDLAVSIGEKVITTYSKVARALGFDGIADGIDKTVESLKQNVKMAEQLSVAEAKLTEARRKSRLIQLEYQKTAEKLRQGRDDESKSIAERIKLNNQLGEVLKKQSKEELAIAQQSLKVAQLRAKAEGKSTENLNAIAEAMTEISDIQERITGQESEQLANLNSLRKEQNDANKARKEAILAQEQALKTAQLEALKQVLGARALATEETIAQLEKIKEKAIEVAQAEYNASAKTKADLAKLDNAKQNAELELIKGKRDIIIESADRETQIYKDSYKKQLEDGKIFNQELLNQKLLLADKIAEADVNSARVRLEQGVINQKQFNDTINAIDAENEIKRNELLQANKEAEQAKELIDIENKRAVDQENFIYQADLERQRDAILMQQEIDSAEQTGADVEAIKAKYAEQERQRDELVNENKLQLASTAFGNIAKLLGEQTAVGKVAAIAQATIDTYKGAVSAYSAMSGIPIVGPALGAVAAGVVVASGVANVKKIASTKTPKAKKGATIVLGGNSHENGGNALYDGNGNQIIEAEKGEALGILNRSATNHFMDFNDAFNGSSTPTFGNSGGTITQSSTSGVNLNPISEMFTDAVSKLPAPIVTVQDILYGSEKQVRVESAGDLG